MAKLFKIGPKGPEAAQPSSVSLERQLEDWIARDVSLIGLDVIIIGRSVYTDHGTEIDLLALDSNGGLVVIELKRNKTPRDVVAQVLDYAAWVRTLTTSRIHEMAELYLQRPLSEVFQERFGDTLPERLNGSHSMLIVAGEFDSASRRIVEYLAEEHDVAINTFFFSVFSADGSQWMTTDSLLDQAEVEERSVRRTQLPWSGYWYVNAGQDHRRSWNDMKKYGFVSAGGGEAFSSPLKKLLPEQPIFVYQKGEGYVGYGIVVAPRVPARDFQTKEGLLFDQPLEQDGMKRDADDPDRAEYVVEVDWKKTFPVEEAKWFKGGFSNQNIVCRLQHRKTIEFLLREFDVESDSKVETDGLVDGETSGAAAIAPKSSVADTDAK